MQELGNYGDTFNNDDDDLAKMEELERDMDNYLPSTNTENDLSSPAILPPGAVPSRNGKLSAHAAEFWFPECMKCPCCKGFRHGCSCCSAIIDTCTHPNCTSFSSTPSENSGDCGRSNNYNQISSPSSAQIRLQATSETEVCRYFVSGNCNFGNTCRFLHPNSVASTTASPSNSTGPQPCIFYSQGKCTKGSACRFSHD